MFGILLSIILAPVSIILAPDTAQVGTPVLIKAEVSGDFLLDIIPKNPNDSVLEVSDRSGAPVIVFWSQHPGTRTIILVTGEPLNIEYKELSYGSVPVPVPPVPVPPVPGPSPDLQKLVAPLVSFVNATSVKQEHLALLQEFYTDFAEVVSEQNIIKNNSQFREAYVNAGKLFFNGRNVSYSGLSDLIEKVLISTLGTDPGAFDRSATVKVLQAISWAFKQGER